MQMTDDVNELRDDYPTYALSEDGQRQDQCQDLESQTKENHGTDVETMLQEGQLLKSERFMAWNFY